jgi:hypothetical protein
MALLPGGKAFKPGNAVIEGNTMNVSAINKTRSMSKLCFKPYHYSFYDSET